MKNRILKGIITSFLIITVNQALAIPAQEEAVILELDKQGWQLGKSGDRVCFWSGIKCENGHIVSIIHYNLYSPDKQTHASILPELGQLTQLKELYLSGATGPIPTELGQLTQLTSLTLRPHITGSIPIELSQLTNLTTLSITGKMTGSIPSELGQLTNLNHLNLSGNKLTGTIPPTLKSLENLHSLYLNDNQLTGFIPPALSQLRSLKNLYLNNNQLTGFIPPELSQLTSLGNLSLSNNQLTGFIPPELSQLTFLRSLYLNNNQLIGKIPQELNQLTIPLLNLGHNQLTGNIPTGLPGNFSSNRLEGNIQLKSMVRFITNTRYPPSNHSDNCLNISDLKDLDIFLSSSTSSTLIKWMPQFQRTDCSTPTFSDAVYDENTGNFNVPNVIYKGDRYQVKLFDQGDFVFSIEKSWLLQKNIASEHILNPSNAQYNEETKELIIPRVIYFGTKYRVTLFNEGDFLFSIKDVTPW